MFEVPELNKSFETKTEMFKALREANKQIVESKKAQIYNCRRGEHKGAIKITPINKAKLSDQSKALNIDDDYYYLAVNTTNILDSHKDVSINNSWNKTSKDQQSKVYLIWNHEYDPTKVIVHKEDIEILVSKIQFAALGMPYDGDTEALIYKFRKDKVFDEDAKRWLQNGYAIEASVRLQYVKILFAMNSNEPEDKEYLKNYNKYIDVIANKSDFDRIDYFYPVLEQKNILESSLVLAGSNHVTGLITEENKTEPTKVTQEEEDQPSQDTDNKQFYLSFLKNK